MDGPSIGLNLTLTVPMGNRNFATFCSFTNPLSVPCVVSKPFTAIPATDERPDVQKQEETDRKTFFKEFSEYWKNFGINVAGIEETPNTNVTMTLNDKGHVDGNNNHLEDKIDERKIDLSILLDHDGKSNIETKHTISSRMKLDKSIGRHQNDMIDNNKKMKRIEILQKIEKT